ncbi:sporulation protein YunB [Halobacillus shinanisalinarum]|uniref:Sporulation protein YunB n=1 Tax=Halobacillus shinanisalinarum TaxID=2932258 RepID=A0ABY4H2X0_9BACI|nr:sporulation protein YunB [Halobacillus shinanisalinarum]UOQ94250.1 sporulation protein YunB [Halobacillus shinanisalinarum]
MGTKKTNPPSIGKRILITFICFAIITGSCLWLIDRGITPAIQEIATTKAHQLARVAINEAVSKQISEDINYDDLVEIEKDNEGNIVSMGWNSVVVNRALRNTTLRVQHFLRRMEQNDLPMDVALEADLEQSEEDPSVEPVTLIRVPIGLATNNTLLSNLGPEVPVQLQVIGDVQTQFRNEITEYGINAAHFQLWINFKVSLQVVIPFATETTVVTNDIPVDSRTIMGEVPEFYNGDGGEESPTFSLPMTGLQ